MTKNLLLCIRHIEHTGQSAKKYNRKLKTFGFMNTHDANGAGSIILFNRVTTFIQGSKIIYKPA